MIVKKILFVALFAVTGSTPAAAQMPVESAVTAVPNISYAGAEMIREAIATEAKKRGHSLAVVIIDQAGHEILLARPEGTDHTHIFFARQKANTALTISKPSKAVSERVESGQMGSLSIEGLIAVAGGVPISANGKIIGAVGVSGAPAAIDHEIATLALQSIIK